MRPTQSWFNPNVSAEVAPLAETAIIAQFFFDTNVRSVRSQDLPVLQRLVGHLKARLPSRPVELGVVGHADHRGTPSYNKQLGRDRIQSVGGAIDDALRGERAFSYVGGISAGESRALQGTRDEQALAYDRRVDVYSSSRIFDAPVLADTLAYVPGVLRTAHMEWIKADFAGRAGRESAATSLANVLKDQALGWVQNRLNPDNPLAPGKEREWERRLVEVRASDRVNAVTIVALDKTVSSLAGVHTSRTTKVDYVWGRAEASIRVAYSVRSYASFTLLGDSEKPTWQTRSTTTFHLPRGIVERNPFYFPTSTWKPTRVGRP